MTTPGFWRTVSQDQRRVALNGFGEMTRIWYLFPQGGGPRGSFTTLTDLLPNLRTRDMIMFGGVLREQVTTVPEYLHDILIMGVTNRAYQATDSGEPISSLVIAAGATWLAPTSPTAAVPLISINKNCAGWTFENFMMGPPTDAAGIQIVNYSGGSGGIGSSHHTFRDLYFSGGKTGIEDDGGMGFTLTERCRFRGHSGSGGGGIVCVSTSNAVPLQNEVRDCLFRDNQSNYLSSQQNGRIWKNSFDRASATVINTTANSSQGGGNHVTQNSFNIVAAEFDPSGSTGAVVGASDDVWYNYLLDAVESGQPA